MRRVKINLAVFAVLATVTIVWSFTSLFSIDALDRPYTVTAEFESSPGLAPGFEVTYLGTSVGSVKAVDLEDGKSVIRLKIDNDAELPAAIDAAARRKSAIGEPYVDLSPSEGTDPDSGDRLSGGDVIPLERTTVPLSYADLFRSVDALIDAIDPEQLEIVLHETALALDGRGDELRTLVVGGADLTDDLVVHADEIDQFLADIGDMARVAADHRDSIEASLDGLEAIAESMPAFEQPLADVLEEAPPLVRVLHNIFTNGDAGLLCTLDGLAVLDRIVTPEILDSLRASLGRGSTISAILDDIFTPAGDVNAVLLLDVATNAPLYPSKRPQPVAPLVPGCADHAVDTSTPGESDRAGVGDGGDGPFDPDGELDVPGVTEDVDVSLAGSSDLDAPDEPFLSRLLGLAVPAVGVVLLAAVGWFLYGVVRDRRNAAG